MAKVNELSLAEKIEQCSSCVIVIGLAGRLAGAEKLKPTDVMPWSYEETIIEKNTGKMKGLLKKTVSINHKDREVQSCVKQLSLQPYQIEAMVEVCPTNLSPKKWARMTIEQRFLANLSRFDEGFGVEHSFTF